MAVQTERTAKRWKLLMVLSVLVILVGLLMTTSALDDPERAKGVAVTSSGIFGLMLAKVCAW